MSPHCHTHLLCSRQAVLLSGDLEVVWEQLLSHMLCRAAASLSTHEMALEPQRCRKPRAGAPARIWRAGVFLGQKISTLRTRSSKFLMLAYLTKGWGRVGFLCFVATELRYGAAPKDENVENQTNWDTEHAMSQKQTGEHSASSLFSYVLLNCKSPNWPP